MAANAICSSIAGLFSIPANTLTLVTVTVVGQCMGKRDIVQAKKVVKSLLVLTAVSLAGIGLLILPFFYPLVSLFHAPKAIMGMPPNLGGAFT